MYQGDAGTDSSYSCRNHSRILLHVQCGDGKPPRLLHRCDAASLSPHCRTQIQTAEYAEMRFDFTAKKPILRPGKWVSEMKEGVKVVEVFCSLIFSSFHCHGNSCRSIATHCRPGLHLSVRHLRSFQMWHPPRCCGP